MSMPVLMSIFKLYKHAFVLLLKDIRNKIHSRTAVFFQFTKRMKLISFYQQRFRGCCIFIAVVCSLRRRRRQMQRYSIFWRSVSAFGGVCLLKFTSDVVIIIVIITTIAAAAALEKEYAQCACDDKHRQIDCLASCIGIRQIKPKKKNSETTPFLLHCTVL